MLSKRRIWQIVSTVVHNGYFPAYFGTFLYQGFLKGGCTPTLNCYACPSAFFSCPIGALQNFARRRQFPFFLVGFFGVVGMGVGRMACGWLCPFGFLQDGMKKISKRVVPLPAWMGNLKYASLVVLAIALPFLLDESWFSRLCPAGAVEGALPWVAGVALKVPGSRGMSLETMMGTSFWIKMAILVFFLVTMVYVKRPFCRTSCPMGAVFSLFNKLSLVRLKVDPEVCGQCNFCRDVCPVDLVAYKQVDSPECIKCLECTKCPKGAIKVTLTPGGRL
jgi:polyferredoxin